MHHQSKQIECFVQLRLKKLVEQIYLDTNIYCGPLDDQRTTRIRKESQAFLEIADKAFREEVENRKLREV